MNLRWMMHSISLQRVLVSEIDRYLLLSVAFLFGFNNGITKEIFHDLSSLSKAQEELQISSKSFFALEPKCCIMRPKIMFKSEYYEIILLYGGCGSKTRLAALLYQQRFPAWPNPFHKTILKVLKSLRKQAVWTADLCPAEYLRWCGSLNRTIYYYMPSRIWTAAQVRKGRPLLPLKKLHF